MTESGVKIEREGEVAILKLARPPVNAMSLGLLRGIQDGLRALEGEEDVRAVVLAAEGKVFCAGLDLKILPDYTNEQLVEVATEIGKMLEVMVGFRRPLVSAVQGHAIAGGMVLPLTADLRVGAEDAWFGVTEVQVGVPFPPAAMVFLQAELTAPVLRNLVLRAHRVDATEAKSMGLLDFVVPREQVLTRALELARELALHPQEIYGYTKQQMRASTLASLRSHIDIEVVRPWLHQFLGAREGA